MKVDLIAGARPNFVKIAAIIHADQQSGNKIDFELIHTGQHYDENLSGSFFRQLQLPRPNVNLKIGSGSQAQQTASIMIAYENLLNRRKPDFCLVVGDVNSSMACAITAKKMQVKIAHIEAGIRSYDYGMPEEINRLLIDSITDQYFTTSRNASNNLFKTGVSQEQVHFVGNTMIDTLIKFRPKFIQPAIWKEYDLKEKNYLILTLHRPGNVDEGTRLRKFIQNILQNSENRTIIFPAHPRTAAILKDIPLNLKNLHVIAPLPYLEFNYLVERSAAVITDSGGITEETTVLGIPCLTLRNNTERPETVSEGTNEIIGTDPAAISSALERVFSGKWKRGHVPERWDGQAGKRIVDILSSL